MFRGWAPAALLTAAALFALAPSSRAQAPPAGGPGRPKQIYRVAALGDSLTDVRSHGGKYLGYLRRSCPESRFDNLGRGGENVQQMRRRFLREVLGEAPGRRKKPPAYTHVIVFGGVNDLLQDRVAGRTTDKIVGDLAAIYDKARHAGLRVVAVTLSPWSGFVREHNPRRARATREINQWLLSQWQEGKIDHAVDAHRLLACGEEGRLCKSLENPWIRDGLHFNADGHARLGKALHEAAFSDCR